MDIEKWFWNVYAWLYMRLECLIPYRELIAAVLCAIDTLPKIPVILDAGCGAGALLEALSAKYPAAKLIGIDRSSGMCKRARARLPSGVTLHEDDLLSRLQSMESASCHLIVSTNAYYALDDPEAFLCAARRVLAPGGQLVLVNPYVPSQTLIWRAHLRGLWRTKGIALAIKTCWNMPAYMLIVAINVVIALRAQKRTYHFTAPSKLKCKIESAGFVVRAMHTDLYGGTCCMIVASAV